MLLFRLFLTPSFPRRINIQRRRNANQRGDEWTLLCPSWRVRISVLKNVLNACWPYYFLGSQFGDLCHLGSSPNTGTDCLRRKTSALWASCFFLWKHKKLNEIISVVHFNSKVVWFYVFPLTDSSNWITLKNIALVSKLLSNIFIFVNYCNLLQ